jgi:acetyl-CoA acetyltransferase family protein
MISKSNTPVLLSAARTPFLESAGAYSELMSYELGAIAIDGLMQQSAVAPDQIDQVVMGTVLHEINTTNVAREAMLKAGLPSATPAYTVAMAGISPNIAAMNLCSEVALGRMSFGIAGGTENFSDVPIRLSQNIRRTMMKIRQSKGIGRQLKHLGRLRPQDLWLDLPASADYTTGLTMGEACEAMHRRFNIERQHSDEFALRSHTLAAQATQQGNYREQITPVHIGNTIVLEDNSIRADTSMEKLQKLQPIFDKDKGVITAGNSSRFTDGAGAMLIGSLGMADKQGLEPLATFKDYLIAGVNDLENEMLLGPALTIPRLLQRNGLSFDDVQVWEIHEAFATQVLINRKCMASSAFVHERFGKGFPVGEIPLDQINTRGGSLALGNPFAATGIRLIHTAAQRMRDEQQRYAVISTCAGGGLGSALLLENAALA